MNKQTQTQIEIQEKIVPSEVIAAFGPRTKATTVVTLKGDVTSPKLEVKNWEIDDQSSASGHAPVLKRFKDQLSLIVAVDAVTSIKGTVTVNGTRFAINVDTGLALVDCSPLDGDLVKRLCGPFQLTIATSDDYNVGRRRNTEPSGVFYLVDKTLARSVRIDIHQVVNDSDDNRLSLLSAIEQLAQIEED